ncbi:reverse transcriptase domain-containing protein [Pontibacter locisalis]|uniref:RNA-directed DNA polymerase n=1 Tax=Pontibacter locisalis TaxID=1719035 RepID=A0ABW5IMM2_9BACT
MNLGEVQVHEIRSKFEAIQTKEDLLALLNLTLTSIYGDKARKISLKSLTYYSNPKLSRNSYEKFSISKKSGGTRTIHAPTRGLKTIQRCLNIVLQSVFEPHCTATGFIPGKSIVDNAILHTGKRYVYNIDLKDFFPSVDQARVWKCLQLHPFYLNAERSRLHLANMIAALCCTRLEVERQNSIGDWVKQYREVLPQGAPTSPTLTNVVAHKLDVRLRGLAKRFKIKYSRYADDITFSSHENVFVNDGDFSKELQRIIKDQNFQINPKKTRLQNSDFRQEATGLVINEKVNVHRRYIKQIRMWLYYWEKYGYLKAGKIFIREYGFEKANRKKKSPTLKAVIEGKLNFLSMVKGPEDSTYQKLHDRFTKLTMHTAPVIEVKTTELDDILDALVHKGLENAMSLFTSMK